MNPNNIKRLGLGMAALGRPGYITLKHGEDYAQETSPEAMKERAFLVLDAAYGGGLRYFDAARSYGKAEAFLAAWLEARQLPPDAITVGSKWGYTYTAEWQVKADKHEVKDHSLAALQRQYPESKALLGSYLKLYQIHSATQESGVLKDEEVLDELARLRDTGVKIGLSVSGAAQTETIRQALNIRRGGDRLFLSVQATWNLLESSCGEILREAHEHGVSVIVKEALANGRLTPRGDPKTLAPLQEITNELKTTLDAVALAAVLAQPWANIVLLGAVNTEQLSQNMASASLFLEDGMLRSLSSMKENAGEYWAKRSHLSWT
jgi:aryl-alcohol dehydrogenase-like predicted oxidoreductase